MRIQHIFCAVILTLVAVGCGSRSRAVSVAHEIGVSKLRADLQTLIVSPAGEQHEIPQAAWPTSVRQFRPLAVQRHMGGVLIVARKAGQEQQGLLVMIEPKDDPGTGGSGVSYDSLGDGLFWCAEKIRMPYIPPSQRTNR